MYIVFLLKNGIKIGIIKGSNAPPLFEKDTMRPASIQFMECMGFNYTIKLLSIIKNDVVRNMFWYNIVRL